MKRLDVFATAMTAMSGVVRDRQLVGSLVRERKTVERAQPSNLTVIKGEPNECIDDVVDAFRSWDSPSVVSGPPRTVSLPSLSSSLSSSSSALCTEFAKFIQWRMPSLRAFDLKLKTSNQQLLSFSLADAEHQARVTLGMATEDEAKHALGRQISDLLREQETPLEVSCRDDLQTLPEWVRDALVESGYYFCPTDAIYAAERCELALLRWMVSRGFSASATNEKCLLDGKMMIEHLGCTREQKWDKFEAVCDIAFEHGGAGTFPTELFLTHACTDGYGNARMPTIEGDVKEATTPVERQVGHAALDWFLTRAQYAYTLEPFKEKVYLDLVRTAAKTYTRMGLPIGARLRAFVDASVVQVSKL